MQDKKRKGKEKRERAKKGQTGIRDYKDIKRETSKEKH